MISTRNVYCWVAFVRVYCAVEIGETRMEGVGEQSVGAVGRE